MSKNNDNTPRYLYGSVDIELGDRTFTMRPTMAAQDRIDKEYGGIGPALERVRAMSLADVSNLVCIGVGTTSRGGKEKIKELVWEKGVANAAADVVRFLMALLNPSGEEPEDDEVSGEDPND